MDSLVTVIITAYNSSLFIAETLDSVLSQSWKELEIIITDDCSRDNTVEICQAWIDTHKSRLMRAELIVSECNTGVAGNANRGIQAARGSWIKFLGADDTLKPTCIEDNINWISDHPEIKVLFSRVEVYRDSFLKENLINTIPGDPFTPNGIMAPGRDSGSQYKMLLISDRIHFSPSVFINRNTIVTVGGFDEQFKTLEDYPMWLKLTMNGFRLHFMDRITVNYRMHSRAINNTDKGYLIKPNYFRSENFRKLYTYPYLPFIVRSDQKFCWVVCQVFRFRSLNRDKAFNRWIKDILTIYLNPFRYLIWVKKQFTKNLQQKEYYY